MDRDQFKALFLEYFSVLKRRACYIVKNNEAAEDIVQDVFYKFWQNRDSLNISHYKAYLNRSVINTCLNYLDKHKRLITAAPEVLPTPAINDTAEAVAFNDLSVKLQKALENLSPQRRVIFSLSLYESMSNQEIADQMGLRKKTVDNQLGTALKQLREELADFVDLLVDMSWLVAVLIIFFLLGLG